MPSLYIITGSNGAGKSTVGPEYLPTEILKNHTVFDGDLLYVQKLRKLFPGQIKSPKYARQAALNYVIDLFEKQTNEALTNNDDYVYEGHFTNDETWNKPKEFKEAGYDIHLIFFGLENPELSQFRVTEGGHYVDSVTLSNNFYGNLEKFNVYYPLIDNLTIVDTSQINHRILFKTIFGKPEFYVPTEELPAWFTDFFPESYSYL